MYVLRDVSRLELALADNVVSISQAEEYQPPATPGNLPVASVDKEFLKSTESANKMYKIHIGDPTKVGLGATAHIVYTVTTTLRVSTEYGTQSRDVAVLRRFSEFLWLFGVLSSENPGVVVPPVPDKQSFGASPPRFWRVTEH